MPGSTTLLALPYPLPTDQVSEGAADMQALAQAIDPLLANAVEAPGTGRYRLQAGRSPGYHLSDHSRATGTITFPDAFSAVPLAVLLGIECGVSDPGEPAPIAVAWINTLAPASATFTLQQMIAGVVDLYVHWIALGPR